MAGFCSFKASINSCNNQVDKMITNSIYLLRRITHVSDQEDKGKCFTELPNDILKEIISRLDSGKDYLHFIAVCKRWRSIGHDLKSISRSNPKVCHRLLNKSFPMLMQPKRKNGHLLYYSITKRKVRKIHLPEIRNKWIPGSSRGWLAIVDMECNNPIFLLNPITKEKIYLPSLATSPCFTSPETTINDFRCIEKIIIVSPEEVVNSLSNCNIVVFERSVRSLHIYRVGEERWDEITIPSAGRICDVVESKGIIYVVAYYGSLYSVETNPVTNAKVITCIVTDWVIDITNRCYLVESQGDLLMISRIYPNTLKSCYKTIRFQVYILQDDQEHGSKIWKETENIHNQVLFVGRNRTLCLDSNLCPNIEGNCIYFTDHYSEFDRIRAFGDMPYSHDNGVFHMKDRRIEHFTKINDKFSFPAIWFSPNPW